MQQINEIKMITGTGADATSRESIKDAGRVRIGAGAIDFSDPTPARPTTKDSGRVRMGAGAINF